MSLASATDFVSRTPEAVCDSIAEVVLSRRVVSDRWLGDGTNLVCVIGPEHRRYFDAASWSKNDIRSYLWQRFQRDGKNIVGLGRPEGLLIVAAGGDGMAESWLLFPHLAWAITEKV
jgi:hypothetical protein